MIAQAAPAKASITHAAALAFEKTCLNVAIPRGQETNTPIMNATRSAACQTGVITTLMMACAMIDGISDRVQANTTPNPTAKVRRLTTMPTL
jgi:hypothetical protein